MDEFFHNQEQKEEHIEERTDHYHPSNSNKKPKTSLLAIWLSGLTGGLTVAIIGFLLLFSGMIPLNTVNLENGTSSNNEPTQNLIQTVTGDDGVSSEVLSNVAGAVVGVANIQSADLWAETADAGTGSGVIYKVENERAYVVTNHHVIDGATDIEVILTDGERVDAELHGSDELTDLAVLSIDASYIDTVAEFGNSADLIVGETAIAIGNPLGTEFAGTVTKGIISGLDRSLEIDLNNDGTADWTVDVIQTDAAINPGNSGGALINAQGQVIGINSMKIALSSVEGIGFAIPIDEAQPIIEQLEQEGAVSRPFMGISAIDFSSVPPQHVERTLNLAADQLSGGIVIAEIHNESAASQAGLEIYDVITELNGEPINDMMALRQYLYTETEIGDTITVSFYRDGVAQETTVTLQGE
ncbi:serine protease Do [Amphibacillus marinus]|uniref:Serine protease Do n=1 Tax=Amphibacillus marinus TaxID=872970 RepID=A0A1H8JTA8_9BACI|nr:trypsin-like peptidase domain-containing protein [Amphibacillus marinus]SEN83617.1 serine protease Do [Amphibacillus marinus]